MKLFKSYRKEFDTACKVMKGMAEEVIRLREENERLRKENDGLRNANRSYEDELVHVYGSARKARESLAEIKK